MYDEKFSDIYDNFGWDTFSTKMGNSILKYFENKEITIKSNLDLCCGVGTLCNLFYNNGIKTVGVDSSKNMIEYAKEKFPNIKFIEKNILEYDDNEKYDLITMTCDSVNHLLEDNDLNKLFSNVSKLIKNNGYFIFDIIDQKKLALNEIIESKRDNNIMVYYLLTKDSNLLNTNVKVCENNMMLYETNIKERIYSFETIKELAQSYGFIIEKLDDSILGEKHYFNEKLYFILKKN